jgi:restriction system protein
VALKSPRPIPQEEVLYEYALGELLEPRHGFPDTDAMAAAVARATGPTQEERQQFIRAICAYREPMLGFLLRNETTWFEAFLDADELAALRLTRWFEQPRYEGARTIEALLRTQGAHDFTLPAFRPEAMRGRIVVVAPELAGPTCLIEGTRRCCEIVRHRRAGAMAATSVAVHVGICPNIDEYAPFQGGVPVKGTLWWAPGLPEISVKALLEFGDKSQEGVLVEAVTVPWYEIIDILRRDPDAAYVIDPFKWEHILAGAYERAGFDEVILTPRSGDRGRDVIATKHGVGSIRIVDQMKAYAPDGVLGLYPNVSKAVLTTTSDFSRGVLDDPEIRRFVPHRLELKPRDVLLPWLESLAVKRPPRR